MKRIADYYFLLCLAGLNRDNHPTMFIKLHCGLGVTIGLKINNQTHVHRY